LIGGKKGKGPSFI